MKTYPVSPGSRYPFGATPEGIKPEWYFLFMFETLKEAKGSILGMDSKAAVIFFFAFVGLVIVAVPFLDRGAEQDRPRRVLNILATIAVIFFVAMTIRGFAS